MGYTGTILSIGELIASSADPGPTPPGQNVGIRHTAADNAAVAAKLLADGQSLDACWRLGILQTLDDYTSTLRRGGPTLAAGVFIDEPAPTGAAELDAAFAALADYLAGRDSWTPPAWALNPHRTVNHWYPAIPDIFRDQARRESPPAFARRGIHITTTSLNRA